MKTFLAITAFAVCQFAAAQATKELKDLKTITVGADMKINLVKGPENKIVFEGNEEEINIDYNNGNLKIEGDGSATVYYKNGLESITAGSDAEVKGTDEIKGKAFILTAGSDSEVQLNLNVQDLTIAAGSDANVTLKGKAEKMNVAAGSDAEFNAKELSAGDVDISLGSDAEGTIKAKGVVNAVVTSDAQLTIHGGPKKVNETKSGDAEITVVR